MSFIILLIEIIVIGGMLVGLHQKNTNLVCKSKRRLDGKTVIVTGGTSGMGLEIATDFAHRGAKVIVACPFIEEGTHGKKLIIRSSGNENVIFKLLDQSSFKSIREFAAYILENEDRLDILINNAGVGVPYDHITEDGLNFVMQVNYFGTFLLTLLLLPLMRKTGTSCEPSRIVNTSSTTHRLGKIDFETWGTNVCWDVAPFITYKTYVIYGTSKLCVAMFTRELAKILKGSNVIVNSVDPGLVGTNIFQGWGNLFANIFSFIFQTLFKNPWEGAQTAIYAAMSVRAGKVSGEYFKNCKQLKARSEVYDEKICQRLWETSLRLVKIKDEEYL